MGREPEHVRPPLPMQPSALLREEKNEGSGLFSLSSQIYAAVKTHFIRLMDLTHKLLGVQAPGSTPTSLSSQVEKRPVRKYFIYLHEHVLVMGNGGVNSAKVKFSPLKTTVPY